MTAVPLLYATELPKYEITDIVHGFVPAARRIRALRDIPRYGVCTGDLGGWVESPSSLSQRGDAWVADNGLVRSGAFVRDDAFVGEQATLCDGAWAYGEAQIRGYARVSGVSKVGGTAILSGVAQVGGNAIVRGGARLSSSADVVCIVNWLGDRDTLAAYRTEGQGIHVSYCDFDGPLSAFEQQCGMEANPQLRETARAGLEYIKLQLAPFPAAQESA